MIKELYAHSAVKIYQTLIAITLFFKKKPLDGNLLLVILGQAITLRKRSIFVSFMSIAAKTAIMSILNIML